MDIAATRLRVGALLISLTLAACGGSGQQAAPGGQVPPAQNGRSPLSASTTSISLPPLGQGYNGKMTVSFVPGRGSQLRVEIAPTDTSNGTSSGPPCPSIPPIQLQNISSTQIVIVLKTITINVPCNVSGQQFGVSAFQLIPQPAIVQSAKLGEAAGSGSQISFSSTQQITLPPMTTSEVTILSDPSGTEVALPVAPNSTSVLTSGKGSNIPTDLSFFYTSGQGASLYTTSCFPGSQLPLSVPRVGRPSFFCHFNPGTSSITFGQLVKFYIGVPLVDRSVLGLDGPNTSFICGTASTSTECDTSSFTVSNTSPTAFQNVIVGNVDDLRACVPVTPDTDCNSLTAPAPSTTTISHRVHDFELLVADDATYHPGAGPWDGLFRHAVISGPCAFGTGPDSGDGPPGYTDSNLQGPGPLAEFDITTSGTGVCTITVSEDPKFIIGDFSNPANPLGRSVQLSLTII